MENKITPKIDGLGAVYPTIFPVEYYKNIMDKEKARHDKDKWYLRPHHIETLTEHPHSLKDNLLDSNYYSFYTELEKDMDGRFLSPEESAAKRAPKEKDILIANLEQQLNMLKLKMAHQQPSMGSKAGTLPVYEMQKYYMIEDNEDLKKESVTIAFETIMDTLRNQEKDILNKKRDVEAAQYGMPEQSWYTNKSHRFTTEMKKFDRMSKADPQREENIRRLMNRELY